MAARYTVGLTPAARRDLRAVPKKMLARIDARLLSLAENPRPPAAERLKGADHLLRVRVGDYRIVYELREEVLLLLVIRIRHRREVYRNL